jgi:hypothetical protein
MGGTTMNIQDILSKHVEWTSDNSKGERANLSWANLSRANLSWANLSGANLSGANLSGAKGLLNPTDWMSENFISIVGGYVVYKAFGVALTPYSQSCFGKIRKGKYITEVVNPLPTVDCGCGINFATLEWVRLHYPSVQIRECLIEWKDLATLVVPYNTDGKARVGRLKVGKIVNRT